MTTPAQHLAAASQDVAEHEACARLALRHLDAGRCDVAAEMLRDLIPYQSAVSRITEYRARVAAGRG